MADIVKIEQFQREHGKDDARFLECPECHSVDFSVIVRFANGKPFIAGLVCGICAEEEISSIGVINGFLE